MGPVNTLNHGDGECVGLLVCSHNRDTVDLRACTRDGSRRAPECVDAVRRNIRTCRSHDGGVGRIVRRRQLGSGAAKPLRDECLKEDEDEKEALGHEKTDEGGEYR